MPERQQIINIFLILSFAFILSCRDNGNEKAVAELEQKQKQALHDEKAKVIELIGEMETAEDSLRQSYDKTQKEKTELTERLKELEAKSQAFSQEKKKDELRKLELEKLELNKQLSEADQTLTVVQVKLADLQKKEKTIENRMVYVDESKQMTKQTIRSEMTNVDSTINNLESEKQIEQKKIPILQKKISISKTKIQAYQDEKELFEQLRTNKIRENAPESDIETVEKKIIAIDEEINTEHLKMADAKLQIANSENRIVEFESQLQKLTQLVRDKYDKKEVLTEFIGRETTRLKQERERIQIEKLRLKEQEKLFDKEKKIIANSITELNGKIELLTGQEAESIRTWQARLDKMESEIAEYEAKVMDEKHKKNEKAAKDSLSISPDEEVNTSLQKLSRISDEVAKEKVELSRRQAELADERNKVLKEKADVSEKRVRKYKTWGYTVTLLIVLAILILVALYFIGKSVSRKKRK